MARLAMRSRPPLTGALFVSMTFTVSRPKSHYVNGDRERGTLKISAPAHPVSKPDALKLARAVEDAMTGIVYVDDAQIVDGHQRKTYGLGRMTGVHVLVESF